jgi:hypothetical protein
MEIGEDDGGRGQVGALNAGFQSGDSDRVRRRVRALEHANPRLPPPITCIRRHQVRIHGSLSMF